MYIIIIIFFFGMLKKEMQKKFNEISSETAEGLRAATSFAWLVM